MANACTHTAFPTSELTSTLASFLDTHSDATPDEPIGSDNLRMKVLPVWGGEPGSVSNPLVKINFQEVVSNYRPSDCRLKSDAPLNRFQLNRIR